MTVPASNDRSPLDTHPHAARQRASRPRFSVDITLVVQHGAKKEIFQGCNLQPNKVASNVHSKHTGVSYRFTVTP